MDKWTAERKTMEKMFSGIAEMPIKVESADCYEDYRKNPIGYTSENGSIYLSYRNDLTMKVSEEEATAIRMGVGFHETLHKIRTNFKLLESTIRRMPKYEGQIFHEIDNILEDAAIEEQATMIAGGTVIDCLEFAIAKTYEFADNLETINNPLSQFIAALIMFGDMGVLKGQFTFELSRKIFMECAPIFYEGIHAVSSKKRNECSLKIFELAKPLWEPLVKQQEAFEEFMKELHDLMSQLGVEDNNGTGSGMDADGNGEGEGKDGKDGKSGKDGEEANDGKSSKKDDRRKITIKKLSKEEFEKKKKELGGNKGSKSGNSNSVQGSSGVGSVENTEILMSNDENDNNDVNCNKNNQSDGITKFGNVTIYTCEEDEEKNKEKGGNSSDKKSDKDKSDENDEGGFSNQEHEESDKDNGAGSSDRSSDEKVNKQSERNNKSNCSGQKSDDKDNDDSEMNNDSDSSNCESDDKNNTSKNKEKNGEDGEQTDKNSSQTKDNNTTNKGNLSNENIEDDDDGEAQIDTEEYHLSEETIEKLKQDIEKSINEEIEVEDHVSKTELDLSIQTTVKRNVRCSNEMINVSNMTNAAEAYHLIEKKLHLGIRLMTNKMRDIFRNDIEEKVYKNSGSLNFKRIYGGKVTSRVFDKIKEPENKSDFSIFLLIDESGSMSGDPSKAARECAIALTEVFQNLNIPIYIMGFTADRNGYQAVHYHYMRWNSNKNTKYSLININGRSNNFDGYSIRYAAQIMKKRNCAHKLMIVISDGQPACSSYRGMDGVKDTINAIKEARKYTNVLGVLIGNSDVETLHQMYGNDFMHVSKVEDLYSRLSQKISRLIENEI